MLHMTPITDQDSGLVYAYRVRTNMDDEVGEYRVVYDSNREKCLHFVARGISRDSRYERYVVNFDRGTVDRFRFNTMNAHTVDFSTAYQTSKLQNDLLANYRQYALNFVSQTMMQNKNKHPGLITLAFGLSLDMFSDYTSLDNYIHAGYPQPDAASQNKFSEVFKNHVVEIDDTGMEHGLVYGRFLDKIAKVFGDMRNITLVDGSSIKVKRVTSGSSGRDEFTYEVLMDINII